jgi:hypothetical protein
MLVRPNDGAVHVVDVPINLTGGIRLRLDLRKEAAPQAGLAPTVEAAGHGGPRAIALGQDHTATQNRLAVWSEAQN